MATSKFFEIEGYLFKIFPVMTFPSGFKKREFILEVRTEGRDGMPYKDLVSFEITKDWMAELDNIGLASKIKVHFLLGGKGYSKDGGEEKYFNYLRAWKVEVIENNKQDFVEKAAPKKEEPVSFGNMDDDLGLPF